MKNFKIKSNATAFFRFSAERWTAFFLSRATTRTSPTHVVTSQRPKNFCFCPEPVPWWAAFIDSSIGGICPVAAATQFLIHHNCCCYSVAQVATSVPRPMDRTPIQSQVCSSPAGPSGLSDPAQCK